MSSESATCIELRSKIPADWAAVPLDAVTDFQEGPGILAKDFHGTGIPLLRLRNIETPSVQLEACNFLDPEKVNKKWGHFALKEGDLLISTSASLGRVSVVGEEAAGSIAYTGIIRFRSSSPKLDHKFLRAFLSSAAFIQQAEQMATGSVIKHFGPSHLRQMAIALPSIHEQVHIAGIFDALDERIRLLRETNATLEAIAQAMFKSWFVDFDPVHAKQQGRAPEGMSEATAALFPDSFEESELGLVPRGWKVAPLGDVVESVGGGTPDTKELSYWEGGVHCWTTPKDLSGIQAPVLLTTERKLTAKGLAKVSSGLLPAGTLLLSSRAPIGYLAIAQVPMAINQGYIAMLPNSQLPPLFMLFWCRQNMEIIKGRANGSTFMEISKKAFRPIPALVPPAPVLDEFIGIAGVLFERLVSNEQQAQTLATLRDTLLPRLISGQLRLPQAEAALEEVAG
jgi:type I restriction enzyme S subunit